MSNQEQESRATKSEPLAEAANAVAAEYRRATDVAGVCKDIVTKTAVKIANRRYVKVEGWLAIATAHGCVASSERPARIEDGYEARGVLRRLSDGALIAEAWGFVGDDERRWADRHLFARKAMCQTRALSRVCRSAFSHVVVLMDAGLETTPAEEMLDRGDEEAPPESNQPRESNEWVAKFLDAYALVADVRELCVFSRMLSEQQPLSEISAKWAKTILENRARFDARLADFRKHAQ
jgi:hypothetical protein